MNDSENGQFPSRVEKLWSGAPDMASLLALIVLRTKGITGAERSEIAAMLRKKVAISELIKNCSKRLLSTIGSGELVLEGLSDLESWRKLGIGTITLAEAEYPDSLASIYDPPLMLFYRGEIEVLQRACFAIVGSRKADQQGCALGAEIAKTLAQSGLCIVSGLALGVDGAAHRGALASDALGSTVAVLGHGLSMIYPRAHESLAEKILTNGGLLLSQFEPAEKPYPSNFINRNRVIAGLSQGVLVIQAGKRSGSLVTARFAMEEGRDLFVIPGSVVSSRFEGSHHLIRQGAALVTGAEHILEELGLEIGDTKVRQEVSRTQQEILQQLREVESLHFNELSERVADSTTLSHDLLELELAGLLIRLPGNFLAIHP